MNRTSLDRFADLIEEMGHAFYKAVRYGMRALATMSWPGLLVTCVALAMAITIIPLALFLFMVFLGLKLIIAAIILSGRRRRALPEGTFENKAD